LKVSEETLALDLIYKVGHQGDFLSTEHTMRHLREDWYPKLFDRNNFEGWQSDGGKDLRKRAKERIEQILAEHQPEPLPVGVQAKIDAIAAG
jgi:trimethylamine--corrinoid protein Co-methyltransferase